MREIREVLRLKHEQGLTHRPISASVGISSSSVGEYLKRAKAAGVTWKVAEELSDAELEARLFRQVGRNEPQPRAPIDFKWVTEQMRYKGVTLELLWQEYQEAVAKAPSGRIPYQYSQFCELYRQYRSKMSLVMRQEHRAGEKCFIDFSGKKPRIVDATTGEEIEVELFVMVLGASNYTYAEATRTQGTVDFISATVRGLEYFGGVSDMLVPDNLKSGVKIADRYEPELNATYAEMGQHYGTAIVPARPKKPRDKAKVEVGVQLVQRWILARLRHRRFFSLEELNAAIWELLEDLNTRPFKKLEGCRRSLFERLDRPALRPLPSRRYEVAQWKLNVGVGPDYHIEYDHRLYSVPHELVQAKVDVRATANVIEVWRNKVRITSHERSHGPRGTAVTKPEHRPRSHQEMGAWPPERLVGWAAKTGPRTAEVVDAILQRGPHPESGRRACLGLMRLAEQYGAVRTEAACERALRIGNPTMKSVKSILRTGLDRAAAPREVELPHVVHENIRGGAYFDRDEQAPAVAVSDERPGEQEASRTASVPPKVERGRDEQASCEGVDIDEIEARYLVEERLGIMNDSLAPVEPSRAEAPAKEVPVNEEVEVRRTSVPATRLPELIARLRTTWSRPTRVERGSLPAPRRLQSPTRDMTSTPPCASPTECLSSVIDQNEQPCEEGRRERDKTTGSAAAGVPMDCLLDEEHHTQSSTHSRDKE